MSDVNRFVGQKIRLRRKALGKSQLQVAAETGVSHQQMQKYEAGENRVSAPVLWAVSRTLGVRVDYFFEGLAVEEKEGPRIADEFAVASEVDSARILHLVRGFRRLEDAEKSAVLALVNSMAGR